MTETESWLWIFLWWTPYLALIAYVVVIAAIERAHQVRLKLRKKKK